MGHSNFWYSGPLISFLYNYIWTLAILYLGSRHITTEGWSPLLLIFAIWYNLCKNWFSYQISLPIEIRTLGNYLSNCCRQWNFPLLSWSFPLLPSFPAVSFSVDSSYSCGSPYVPPSFSPLLSASNEAPHFLRGDPGFYALKRCFLPSKGLLFGVQREFYLMIDCCFWRISGSLNIHETLAERN